MLRRFLPMSRFLFVVYGCDGGRLLIPHIPGSPGSPEPPAQEASPGGVWQGTSSLGFGVVGFVSESGQFNLWRLLGPSVFP